MSRENDEPDLLHGFQLIHDATTKRVILMSKEEVVMLDGAWPLHADAIEAARAFLAKRTGDSN